MDRDAAGGERLGTAPVLRVLGVTKRFGALSVLEGVNLELRAGEVLALVGENGAGKTTLVQCIARTYAADSGTIELAGTALAHEAMAARDQGVAVVWQDLALCDNLSAAANIFLGNERRNGVLLDESAMALEAVALFRRLHIAVAPLQPVATLSGGQRQLVAIARAVLRNPSVLVLDEPTASLGVTETQVVEWLLSELRGGGTAILLVSHRLEQVFKLADRIAVLRDGRIVAEVSPHEVHPDDIIAMISGVEADSTARRQLRRLRSLVEQLAEVEPAASLPLIVSAMAEALAVDQLCVHLLDQPKDGGEATLRQSAAVGLSPPAPRRHRLSPPGYGRWSAGHRRGQRGDRGRGGREARSPLGPAADRGPAPRTAKLLVRPYRRFARRARHHLGVRRHGHAASGRSARVGLAVRQSCRRRP